MFSALLTSYYIQCTYMTKVHLFDYIGMWPTDEPEQTTTVSLVPLHNVVKFLFQLSYKYLEKLCRMVQVRKVPVKCVASALLQVRPPVATYLKQRLSQSAKKHSNRVMGYRVCQLILPIKTYWIGEWQSLQINSWGRPICSKKHLVKRICFHTFLHKWFHPTA